MGAKKHYYFTNKVIIVFFCNFKATKLHTNILYNEIIKKGGVYDFIKNATLFLSNKNAKNSEMALTLEKEKLKPWSCWHAKKPTS